VRGLPLCADSWLIDCWYFQRQRWSGCCVAVAASRLRVRVGVLESASGSMGYILLCIIASSARHEIMLRAEQSWKEAWALGRASVHTYIYIYTLCFIEDSFFLALHSLLCTGFAQRLCTGALHKTLHSSRKSAPAVDATIRAHQNNVNATLCTTICTDAVHRLLNEFR